MYENKTELDRMKNTVQELQQENKRLLKENESLSKSITTKSTSNHQYNATRTPEFTCRLYISQRSRRWDVKLAWTVIGSWRQIQECISSLDLTKRDQP